MARLPVPGADEGTWGVILNDFLSLTHNNDGSLKSGTVSSSALANGSVTQSKLSAGSASNGQVLGSDGANLVWTTPSGGGGSVADATTGAKGIVQLAGDLGGTAAAPTVPGLAGKANTSHTHAISDVTNLQTALNAKADTSALASKADVSALASKADTSALAAKADVSALAGKADLSHTHAISDVTNLQTTLNNKADTSALSAKADVSALDDYALTTDLSNYVPTSQLANYVPTSQLANYTPTSGLATVATSGSYNDLTNKPTIPAAQVNSDWNSVSGVSQILNKPTIPKITASSTAPSSPSVGDMWVDLSE